MDGKTYVQKFIGSTTNAKLILVLTISSTHICKTSQFECRKPPTRRLYSHESVYLRHVYFIGKAKGL